MINSDFIKVGLKKTLKRTVNISDTAKHYGSGSLAVFATPAMISFMESTSIEVVEEYLESGFGTVGTSVNIKHIKAIPVNSQVSCTSELIERDNRRLVFRVRVFDDEGLIGEGTHERFIIDEQKFLNKISR